MRGLTRRWILREALCGTDAASVRAAPLEQRVLAARGLVEAEVVARFCEPKLTHLHEPGLLPGAERAAGRIVDAVRAGERLVIYGDYDVDGITATAILFHTIRAVRPDADVRSYVPHRLDEGYGLNDEAIRQIARDGADLVISVDCGISARGSAAVAKEVGLDLIITDHHNLPDGPLPEAHAVVHPRLPGGSYPFGELSGAGVAFKLAWCFARAWCGSERVSEHLQRTLLDLLPMAALGTIADVVPLVDENRVLAFYGLRLIKQTPYVGLRALIEVSGLMDEKIDCEKVGFVLGPRLNACGRMGHAAEAVRLLTVAGAEESAEIAQRLNQLNRRRQDTERSIFEEAARRAEDCGMVRDDRRVICLADETWHPGVVGIVCSRLVDRFGRPSILLQRQGEVCRGSARSIDGFSMYDALSACRAHLLEFGGHDAAAGLVLESARLEAFVEALAAHALERIGVEQMTPAITIDCDTTLAELDQPTVTRVTHLSPFGRANPRPTLRVQNAVVLDPPRQIGRHGRHLSLRLREDGPHGRRVVRTVWFGGGQYAGDLAAGMRLDVAIEPKLNTWQGRTSVEAEIRDVRLCERQRAS